MSFFNNLFGGKDKKEKKAPPKKEEVPMDFQVEAAQNKINSGLTEMDNLISKYQIKIQQHTLKAKDYASKKNKKAAMQQLSDVKDIRKNMEVSFCQKLVMDKRKLLKKQKNQLQMQKIDHGMVDVMDNVNKIMKQNEKMNDKMYDVLADAKQNQDLVRQRNDMIKDLTGTNEQQQAQLEDEFAELQKQMNQQQANKVKNQFNGMQNVHISNTGQKQASKQKSAFQSQLDGLLN